MNATQQKVTSATAQIAHKRYRRDRSMSVLVSLAGWLILLMLASLIWHLCSNSAPLFFKPKASLSATYQLADMRLVHLGDLKHGGVLILQDELCQLHFYRLQAEQLSAFRKFKHPCGHRYIGLTHQGQSYLVSLSQSGIVRLESLFVSGEQVTREQQLSFAVENPDNTTQLQIKLSDRYLALAVGDQQLNWQTYWVELTEPTQIKQHQLGHAEQLVLLADIKQQLLVKQNTLEIRDADNQLVQSASFPTPINKITALPSQRSFILGLKNGQYQQWSLINKKGQLVFQPTYAPQFEYGLQQVIQGADANSVLVSGADGYLYFYNSTTGEVLRHQQLEQSLTQVGWHAEHLYAVHEQTLNAWQLSGLAGFASWKTLFAKNWYEGYKKPAYVWQSSAASDNQQTKYSLIPLLIGSVKAAMLALVIAIPVAISAAVYTAYFAQERLRNWLKPAIELLEAVPSVVIGFIAAVWLMPLSESLLLPMVLFILLIPLSLFGISFVQAKLVRGLPRPLRRNWELLFTSILILLLMLLIFSHADWLNMQLQSWLNWQGNKSTLVVAIALGIAIAPSIYSVAEDAIHGVPEQIKNASFALGASRLQTLQRVVLVVSLPGILSAITLGFGRAFGETMILLMVTGNTPVSEWDLVSGIRALTANLAIELPEAQPGSSLFHVLFLTALLLFIFTFLINALAEWLRVRLRKNYQYA